MSRKIPTWMAPMDWSAHVWNSLFVVQSNFLKNSRPWQDSNLQSPDPKSGALSIRPHGLVGKHKLTQICNGTKHVVTSNTRYDLGIEDDLIADDIVCMLFSTSAVVSSKKAKLSLKRAQPNLLPRDACASIYRPNDQDPAGSQERTQNPIPGF